MAVYQEVADFVHWVKTTPHDSLTGNSRVAYDAQVRVLDQLLWFLEGKDDSLNTHVAWAKRDCDCAASGNQAKPKQHGADPHAKNCNVYIGAK